MAIPPIGVFLPTASIAHDVSGSRSEIHGTRVRFVLAIVAKRVLGRGELAETVEAIEARNHEAGREERSSGTDVLGESAGNGGHLTGCLSFAVTLSTPPRRDGSRRCALVPDNSWDFMDPASRDRVLTVIRRDADDFFALVSDPGRWRAGTACEGWEVRDVVGHMIDATEGYFPGWEAAHTGATTPEPVGLTVMAARCDANAKAFRGLSQDEAIAATPS